MWSFTKPTGQQIDAFLARQAGQPFSYVEVGQSLDGFPAGYDLDHNRTALGKGALVFERACAALRDWQMFPHPWTEIRPARTALVPGNTVVMLARAFRLWWLNACRIVYVLDEREPVRRFGFAYGTLPGHVERGEERFTIEWGTDDVVWYDIRAFSRPRYWLVRLGYPLARRLQRRFVRDSQAALKAIVAGPTASTGRGLPCPAD